METNIVVTIDGTSMVEAPCDLVSFAVDVKAKSEALESAKKQVEEKTFNFIKSLENRSMKLEGVIETSRSNYKLEHREGMERYPAGYQSVNTIKWTCAVDNHLTDLYKHCMEVDRDVFPMFSIKDRPALVEKAISNATDNAKEKLKKECNLLGVDPKALKIHNWNYGYDGFLPDRKSVSNSYMSNAGPYGATGATGPQGPQGSVGGNYRGGAAPVSKLGSIYQEELDVKLVPGNVSANVIVRINYVWA